MKKKRFIPFRWLPASWGLAGPVYETAEAYYYYDGYDLDIRLAQIEHGGSDGLEKALAAVDLKHGVIDEGEYNLRLAELEGDDVQVKIARLKDGIAKGQLPEKEGEKQIANLMGIPWISVINDGIDHESGVNGFYFEFDWNDHWIKALREAGYVGTTEESLVQQWFQDICRAEASLDDAGLPPMNSSIVWG